VTPNETTYEPQTGVMLPLHGALMHNLAVVFTEAACLDDIAADCAEGGRYEAFFCPSPIKVVGGNRRFGQSDRAEIATFQHVSGRI
jgi:hypothetical protein